MSDISRRNVLQLAGAGAAAAAIAATPITAAAADAKPSIAFKNEDFYTNGKFDAEKGKDAVLTLMKYHGYPIFPGIKEKIWISDYSIGQFTKLGLAAVMFKNNEADRYMLMDIYLLPGQFLPEHWHIATAKNPAKMEGWLIRHGLSYVGGEGEPNMPPEVVIPQIHLGGTVSVKHVVAAKPGDFVPLVRVTSHHWQMAGPEGVILTEVANVHDNDGVRHAEPKLIFP